MSKNARRPAATNSQAPKMKTTLPPILTGLAAIEKAYLNELASVCQQAALTDDAVVIETTLQLFDRVPGEVRRMRRERAELSRSNQLRWSA